MLTAESKSLTSKLCARCRKNKPLHGAARCRKCQDIVNLRQKVLRAARQAQGLCKCGRQPPRPNRVDCQLCQDEITQSANVTHRARKKAGLCLCGKPPDPGYVSCAGCRETDRLKNERRRKRVLTHYGLKCACCGEDTIEFLEIDHVNGDGQGNDHRREIGYGGTYLWLIKHNFPTGFQTLCSNCNRAKFRYGMCPHQRKRQSEPGNLQ